ncbi:hypothetical protein [Rhizobium sp. BK176]|uniref:hypothetical protein n=1 Tax=Rhizobium sp. BK176 TaxID=2587071 RepID=UPI0021699500|nr:hypothetical protein [Rhizobium sp. BK176]MCS4089388.1 hypothetical protein [Rhizobium sp. BK176]
MSKEIGPIAQLDDNRAYRRYFDGHAKSRKANGLDLGLIVDATVTMSVETIWPALLTLSRRVAEGDIALSNGWTLRTARTLRSHDSTFVMEHEDTPGGFLFNCSIREEPGSGGARFKPAAECDMVSAVTCCAYRADGLFPPGYIGYGHDLEGTLALGFDGSKYQIGKLFVSKPSIHLQLSGMEFGRILMPPSSPVSDPAMAIEALELLGEAFRETGLDPMIDKRRAELGELMIEDFHINEADRLLVEMGVGAVRGTPGERTGGMLRHFYAQAAALDFERLAERLAASVAKLRSDGHDAAETSFDWGDMDNHAFVRMSSETGGMLWIDTQQTPYRIDFSTDENGSIAALTVAAPGSTKTSEDPTPTPEDRGFLGEFVRDDAGPDFTIYEIADFTTRDIRNMNGIVSVIDRLAEKLDVDHKPTAGTAATPSL